MHSSTTRWLVLFALGLAAFILLYERRQVSTNQLAERSARVLPDLALKQVAALSVARGTNYAFRLERANDRWEFRSPFNYLAQPAGVDRLLAGLAQLRRHTQITAADLLAQTNGLRAFGLEPAAVTVVVQQGDQRLELRLGAPTVLDKQLYAQVVGQEGLVTVDAGVLKLFPVSVQEWRDTAVVSLADLRFDRLEVRPITNGFELARNPSNQLWQMTRPLPTRANNAKIQALLERLELARVGAFVNDDPRADLEPYGLQPPERELVFGQATNDILVLQVGLSPTNAPDQRFVRRLANSNVVLVARSALDPWLGGFREFCDHRLVVFKLDAVSRIDVRAEEHFTVERLGTNTWQLVAPYTAPADHLLVLELLAALAELEFVGFEREVATDFAAYGLAPPHRQYRLETTVTNLAGGRTNEVLAQLDIGSTTKDKFFARRAPENSVVTFLDTGQLPRAAYQLRYRRLWDFTTNQIASISIRQFNNTRKLLRTGPAQWTPASGTPGPINSFALEEAAYWLGRLEAEHWVARGEDQLPRYGFGSIDYQVTVELVGADKPELRAVRFGRQTLSGRTAYAAVTLDGQPGPVVFECRADLYDYVKSVLTALPTPAGGAP